MSADCNSDSSAKGHSKYEPVDSGSEQGQELVQLTPPHYPRGQVRDIVKRYLPVPATALAYAAHRLYRHYSPRRRAPWTAFRLAEVYFVIGAALTIPLMDMYTAKELYADDDLAVIAIAGRHTTGIRHTIQDLGNTYRKKAGEKRLRELKKGEYRSLGMFEKLAWWQDHYMWHDQATWEGWMVAVMLWQTDLPTFLDDVRDMMTCSNMLANRTCDVESPFYCYSAAFSAAIFGPSELLECNRFSRYLITLAIQKLFPNEDALIYRYATLAALGLSVPLGILGRRSGRRLLYLPANGIQRLLLGLWFYVDMTHVRRDFNLVTKIKNKHAMAMMLKREIGTDMDREIVKMREVLGVLP
ncbi:hypothetical protein C8Q80DRAFT_117833 [Daedaleopsis nitida]|nr:hypothetical protein C8Q80DRAFT_117833 [Daedaleopsis nitida]